MKELDHHINTNHPCLQCEFCGKTLRSVPDLNLHQYRYHTPPIPTSDQDVPCADNQPCAVDKEISFKCDKCGKSLDTKGKLFLHVESEHEKDQLPQHNTSSVQSHDSAQTTQDILPTVTCNVCASTFTNSNDLSHHITANHATSPLTLEHACFQCSKVFTNHHDLSLHIGHVHREGFPCNTSSNPHEN